MNTRKRVPNLYANVGRRGPLNTQRRPEVSVADMEFWHPGSVWHSLLAQKSWISKLQISATAKRLTRLRGRQFKAAVTTILNTRYTDGGTHDRERESVA